MIPPVVIIPPTCTVGGSNPAITPSLVPSRVTGVAPLAVFFDASSTVATATTRPFHELEFSWNFGESTGPGIAAWGTGSRPTVSRNVATGPVAAHVFETPGTYNVCVTVTDGAVTVNGLVVITVTDPAVVFAGTNTTCVSANTTPVAGVGGCPAGAAVAQQADWATIINTYKGTNKRILLKAGDTFTATTAPSFIDNPGPTEVSSYGVGRARVQGAGITGQYFLWQDGNVTDFRVANLEFDGQAGPARLMAVINGAISNLLFLNNFIHNIEEGIKIDNNSADGIFVVGNTIEDVVGGSGRQGTFLTGTRIAILGNSYDDFELSEHPVRLAGARGGVISSNTIKGAPDGTLNGPVGSKETIAIRSNGVVAPQFLVISDNDILVEGFSGLTLRENASDVISERNYYTASGGQTTVIEPSGARITLRNEIVNATGVAGAYLVRDDVPSSEIHIYNNSIYTASASGIFAGVEVAAGNTSGTNIARNNLQYTPNIPGAVVFLRDLSGVTVSSNNTGDAQSKTTNPGWTITVSMTPLTNFTPLAGYGNNAGANVPVFSDFFGAARTGAYDLGAVNP